MDYKLAMDDFLLYLEVEQNYSANTIRSYEYDLMVFRYFLEKHKRSTDLSDLNASLPRISHSMYRCEILPTNTRTKGMDKLTI